MPPSSKVEYLLTEFGKILIPILNEVALWGRKLAAEKGTIVDVL